MFFPAVLAALSVAVFTARSATAADGSLTPHFKQSSYVNESVTLENKYVTMNFFKRIKGWGWGEILTPEGKLMAVMGMGIRQGETITVTAEGATIYYTVDGTDPRYSASRELVASGGTVNITTGQTLRAYAYTYSKYPSGIVEKAAV